jgi:HlyD family secretion protein
MKALLITAALIVATWILFQNNEVTTTTLELDSPYLADIAQKTVVGGNIIPRQEVEVKSKVSGIIEKLLVQPGQHIRKGDTIALIQPIPNMLYSNAIESQIEQAQINWRTAKSEWEMHKPLYDQQLISASTFEKVIHQLQLTQERLRAEKDNLQLLQKGISSRKDKISNRVISSIDGIILDIPHKEGDYIIEPSAYQSGTTIAVCANMEDLIFEGLVDESDIGKIQEGMSMILNISALELAIQNDNNVPDSNNSPSQNNLLSLEGKVEFISPKGTTDQGTIKFLIRGNITNPHNYPLKANYSANAYIYLDQRQQVMTINERNLITDGNNFYVDVYGNNQQIERRSIQIGISDGLQVEVVKGLIMGEKLKPVLN